MCDFDEAELAEYLLHLEAARARALRRAPAPPRAALLRLETTTPPEAAET